MALDLNDKTSNANNLTNNGATEYTADFPFSNSTEAVAFAAVSSQYLSASDSSSLKPSGNFTVEFWIKNDNNNVDKIVFQSYSENTNQAGIRIGFNGTGNTTFRLGRNTGTVADTDYITLGGNNGYSANIWQHFAFVYDGTKVYIYINGSLDNSAAWTNNPGYAATNYVRIGCGNDSGTNYSFLSGKMDDVRLWNTARSATQILNNYQIELAGNESGLVAYWPFESSLGTSTSTTTSTSTSTSTTSTSTSTTSTSSSTTSTSSSTTSTSSSTSTTSTSTSTTSTSTSTSSSTSTSTSTTTTYPYPFEVDNVN